MELIDCAFPLLEGLDLHDRPADAFDGTNIALLVGSRPRTKGMERAELLERQRRDIHSSGQGAERRRGRRHQGARRRQPRQHQLPDRDEQRARHPPRALHLDDATRPQPRDRPARQQARRARHRHLPHGRLGQPLTHHVPRPLPRQGGRSARRRRSRRRPGLDRERFPAQRGQTRCRHHRGARRLLGRLRRQRRDRPHERLGGGHGRRAGSPWASPPTAPMASPRG